MTIHYSCAILKLCNATLETTMNPQFFEKWTEFSKKIQEPIRALTELNIKTVQGLRYLKPEEFMDMKKPEDYLEKQMQVLIENSHKTLEHIEGSFHIMEKAMLSMVDEVKEVSQDLGTKATKATKERNN